MNKLILIGNGFDLAHRLPTSYNHFVDHFWTHLKENHKKEWAKEMVFIDEKNGDLYTSLHQFFSGHKKTTLKNG